MSIPVKDISVIANKWSQRAAAAGPDYAAGVKAPKADWATNTAAAADAWQQGVTQAGPARFVKGVQTATTAKWQKGAVDKGVSRYPQGVQVGKDNYATGFAPSLQVIAGLNLGPRGPRGSPNNQNRSSAVATALHQAKVGH